MSKDLRLLRVLQIVILAIILILVSLKVPELRIILLFVPIVFALLATVSNLKNNMIALVITFLILMFSTKNNYYLEVFINNILPGTIIGFIAKKILNDKESNKYEPIFMGSIVFIFSIVIYYFISKYIFKIDLLNQIIQEFNKSIEMQRELIKNTTNLNLLNEKTMKETFRNIIPSILFFRGMILSMVVYLGEIYVLKKIKYGDLSEIKFKNFYLPGNAVLISFALYLLTMALSYLNTPLYTDAIFLNLEVVFNFIFIIQGIAVSIYYIKKWLFKGGSKKIFIGALCIGITGFSGISIIGMVDSILDFRNVRTYKSI